MAANKGAVRPAKTEGDGRVYVDYAKYFEFSLADFTAGVKKLPIEAGLIIGVRVVTLTAFDGSATLTVGDTTTSNGFLATADTTITTQYNAACSSGLGTNTYAKGKYYPTGGIMVLTLGGTPTVGKLALHVVYSGYAAKAKDESGIQ